MDYLNTLAKENIFISFIIFGTLFFLYHTYLNPKSEKYSKRVSAICKWAVFTVCTLFIQNLIIKTISGIIDDLPSLFSHSIGIILIGVLVIAVSFLLSFVLSYCSIAVMQKSKVATIIFLVMSLVIFFYKVYISTIETQDLVAHIYLILLSITSVLLANKKIIFTS